MAIGRRDPVVAQRRAVPISLTPEEGEPIVRSRSRITTRAPSLKSRIAIAQVVLESFNRRRLLPPGVVRLAGRRRDRAQSPALLLKSTNGIAQVREASSSMRPLLREVVQVVICRRSLSLTQVPPPKRMSPISPRQTTVLLTTLMTTLHRGRHPFRTPKLRMWMKQTKKTTVVIRRLGLAIASPLSWRTVIVILLAFEEFQLTLCHRITAADSSLIEQELTS